MVSLSPVTYPQVTIRDVDETAMDILIDFCYTSNIVVEENNVQTLLPAACLLQLAEIQVRGWAIPGYPSTWVFIPG